jgi:hypothetical protein
VNGGDVGEAPKLVKEAMNRLALRRPVFHSEADFQHGLAWQIQLDCPDARVRLETRPLEGRSVFLDLSVTLGEVRVAVELKYLVRALSTTVDGERFDLRSQSAHDVRRYDVIKDVCRVEELVAARVADVGFVVVLTNDPAYWTPGRAGTVDTAFRLHEGHTLAGELAWAAHAGAGTMRNREDSLLVAGSYPVRWSDYSDLGVKAGRFRQLVLPIVGPGSPSVDSSSSSGLVGLETIEASPASDAEVDEVEDR